MKLSFVIVEYFSMDELNVCVSSILKHITASTCEIIISSNSRYNADEQRSILQNYPQYKWCFNPFNGGFAYAMNRGLQVSTGDIVIILNPDIEIHYGLESMVEYLDQHTNIGVIAPKIINSNGVLQDSFRDFITPFNFLYRHIKRLSAFAPMVKSEVIQPIVVDWVIGAFIMMSRKAYESVGGLDEAYFLYCEDMGLCKAIKQKGFDTVYFPNMEIVYEGTRSARHSFKYAFIFLKSLCHFWKVFGIIK